MDASSRSASALIPTMVLSTSSSSKASESNTRNNSKSCVQRYRGHGMLACVWQLILRGLGFIGFIGFVGFRVYRVYRVS